MRRLLFDVLSLLVVALTFSDIALVHAGCPWRMRGLKRWSDRRAWPKKRIPREGDDVVIPTKMKILLDEPIPRLRSLTIDGVLVWGNRAGIRLETGFIEVNGEFHLGAENCTLDTKADIFLYGLSNSSITRGKWGTKFIGANPASRLEIHGQTKKSWSKLIQTIKPLRSSDCGVIYDNQREPTNVRYRAGIQVTVWQPDGTLYDFHQYETSRYRSWMSNEFSVKLQHIPKGKIVAIVVYKTIGKQRDEMNSIYKAIERLGGENIREVDEYEPYVLVSVTGRPDLAQESWTKRPSSQTEGIETRALLDLGDLIFSVTSISVKSRWRDQVSLRVLRREIAFPKLSLLHDVSSWKPGDEIVVASTDYDWRQAEVRTVVECTDCEKNQIRVKSNFRYTHFGEVTFGVDERAEVGLLSRNIRIEAELQPECYSTNTIEKDLCRKFGRDTFGGHLKVLRGAFGRIEGAEFVHMGQQALLAKYPIHFHLCDEVPGQYAKNNVIRNSNSRCITIHGTDRLEVSDNVCYKHLGHGIFLEDSAEQHNKIHRNLILGTEHGTLLLTDKPAEWCKHPKMCNLLSSIWITHPNNYFTENSAAGSDGFGIVLSFADRPLGPSFERQKERGLYKEFITRHMRVPEFSRNVMHSNDLGGLWFDDRLSNGQVQKGKFVPENGKLGLNYYDPREPPTPEGTPVETVLSELTLYKNEGRNAWVRAGNIVITNSSFADSRTSYVSAHSIGATSSDVRNSIFIGETSNKGEPFTYTLSSKQSKEKPIHHFDRSFSEGKVDYMISGVAFYQGPVYLDNCYFDQFTNWYYNDSMVDAYGIRPVRPAAAITFHPNNHYPLMPTSGVRNLKFGFCDGKHDSFRMMNGNGSTPFWGVFDGTGNANLHDYDGSLTGLRDSQIVQDRPFFTGPECLHKRDWALAVCPYQYFLLVVRGKLGVLDKKYRGQYPVQIRHDDNPQDVYSQSGNNGHKYIVRPHTSYTLSFNASIGNSPRSIQLRPKFGLEDNDVIRLAFCLPKSTTHFTTHSRYPRIDGKRNKAIWVDSLDELDADTTMKAFYWDRTNGYLYLKMSSPYKVTNDDQECPGDKCLELNIFRQDGGDEPAICTGRVPTFNPKVRKPRRARQSKCKGPDSPKGLGAPIEQGYSAPTSQTADSKECSIDDHPVLARTGVVTPYTYTEPSVSRGCFAEMSERKDFTADAITLQRTMTTRLCIERCLSEKYPFAGLHTGNKCTCATSIGRNGVSKKCKLKCSGNTTEINGGKRTAVSVYTTGASMANAPERCGHQDRGVIYRSSCLYVNFVKESFSDAEKRCKRQGGMLSKIDSNDKMKFTETYLSNIGEDVWFGVKAKNSSWRYLDDTVLGDYNNWRRGKISPRNGRCLFLQEGRGFKWNVSPWYRLKLSICDLPIKFPHNSGNPEEEVCSDGLCLVKTNAMTYTEAHYFCKLNYGRIADVGEEKEKEVVERFLDSQPDKVEFWIDGAPNNGDRHAAYSKTPPRKLTSQKTPKRLKTVCLKEKTKNGCPNTNWIKNGNVCYFDTSLTVKTFIQAQALCTSERGSLLTIVDKAENKFINKFIKNGSAWLDLRYNSYRDTMTKFNGDTPTTNFWSTSNHIMESLNDGLCVAMNVRDGEWRHVRCNDGTRRKVVCKANVFDKVLEWVDPY